MKRGLTYLELEVSNSETILIRVLQIIKKRNIVIQSFVAEESGADNKLGMIKLLLHTDEEKIKLLKLQLEKIIEVIGVRGEETKEEPIFKHHDFVPAY